MNFFTGVRPGHATSCGTASFELPILYFRDDLFTLLFTADYDRVRACMPSSKLHPVQLAGGKAVVGIGAFNYVDTSIGPYGEVAVIAAAVYGSRPPPLLPALLQGHYPGFGYVVLHLPVTTQTARDAGRGVWGYTKFVGDMQFVNTPEILQCRLAEQEQHILTMTVARRGVVLRDKLPLVTYSVKAGELIKTVIPQRGVRRDGLGGGANRLQLGDHPVADSIRELGLADKAFMSRYYLQRSAILPAGQVIEQGVRPLDGYAGSDREGRLSVRYLAEAG